MASFRITADLGPGMQDKTWHVNGPALVYLSESPTGAPIVHRADHPDQWPGEPLDARDTAVLQALLDHARAVATDPGGAR